MYHDLIALSLLAEAGRELRYHRSMLRPAKLMAAMSFVCCTTSLLSLSAIVWESWVSISIAIPCCLAFAGLMAAWMRIVGEGNRLVSELESIQEETREIMEAGNGVVGTKWDNRLYHAPPKKVQTYLPF